MHFKIHGQGKKNLNGDGLAIWYTKERMQKGKSYSTEVCFLSCRKLMLYINTPSSYSVTGPVFGNMDNFTGLGVFVDTYPNEEKYIEVCYSSTASSKVGLTDTC